MFEWFYVLIILLKNNFSSWTENWTCGLKNWTNLVNKQKKKVFVLWELPMTIKGGENIVFFI